MDYQQLIITEPAANFRALARKGLKGRWNDALVKGILYILILSLPLMIIAYLMGVFDMVGNTELLVNNYGAYNISSMTDNSSYNWVTSLYEILVGGALTFGVTVIFLRYRRVQEAPSELLFSGFSNYGRAVVLTLLMTLFTTLWTLLFIIPGIIAYYRYRLAFYILIENPQVSPLEAISISKALMRGNKFKLFCLDLSFIGWALLAVIVTMAVATPIAMIAALPLAMQGGMYTLVVSLVTVVVASVTCGLLVMYQGTSVAAFYERASGLLKYTDEAPPAPYAQQGPQTPTSPYSPYAQPGSQPPTAPYAQPEPQTPQEPQAPTTEPELPTEPTPPIDPEPPRE